MSSQTGSAPRFTRSERSILRTLLAQGGTASDGYAALAAAHECALRSIERAARSLATRGLLTITRRGPRTTTLTLTPTGKDAATATSPPVSADGPMGRTAVQASSPRRVVTAPAGFMGDANALAVARLVLRIGRSESPVELAQGYIEHARPEEIARLLSLLDDFGTLPLGQAATGYEPLDDGLRVHFAAQARKAAQRTRVMASLKPSKVLDEE